MIARSKDALRVVVLSPKGVVWEGKALSVASANSQGPFDLLPQHAHFISLIQNEKINVLTENGIKAFQYKNAVIRVIDDTVTIFSDMA